MLKSTLAALALTAAFVAPVAAENTQQAAITACRTAVAAELGVETNNLTVDRIQTQARVIKVRLETQSDSGKVAADCTFARRAGTTTVALVGAPARQLASEPTPIAAR